MAMDFVAASEQHVEIGDVALLDITGDEISVLAWVKPASTTSEQKVVAKWSDSGGAFSYLLAVDAVGDDKVRFVVNTGSNGIADGTTSMTIGTWHLMAGTYDATTVRAYLDGVEDGTDALTGNINSTTAPVRIGVGSGATSEQPMDGAAEDVRIYDRVLSADEILTIYNSRGRDGIILGLAARYLMNEGAPGVVASGAGVIKDSGPNGLDGTPTNSPTWASGQLAFRRKPLLRT